MRLSNRSRKPIYTFIYSFIGIMFLLGCIAYILEFNKFNVLRDRAWMLLVFPIVLLFYVISLGRAIFDYDSDGETLTFRNYHVLPLVEKSVKDEFPKYKFLKFRIINVLQHRRLYVYISSKKSNIIILKYDISFLKKSEVKDLKLSLNKVLTTNQENLNNS